MMRGGRGGGGMPFMMLARGGRRGMRWLLPVPFMVIFFVLMLFSGRMVGSPMFILFVIFFGLSLLGGALFVRQAPSDAGAKRKNDDDDAYADDALI
jgi:hypothetical protein